MNGVLELRGAGTWGMGCRTLKHMDSGTCVLVAGGTCDLVMWDLGMWKTEIRAFGNAETR